MMAEPARQPGTSDVASWRAVDEPVELLTVDEVARRLKLGRSTVYLLCKNNELPHVTIHRCVRIPADALARWLRSRSNGSSHMADAGAHTGWPGEGAGEKERET
jgi:excisionase family DNA binding protein